MKLRRLSDIKRLYVHCAGRADLDTAAKVDALHKSRGWHGIGYNAFIKVSGLRETGRNPKFVPAHAFGFNDESMAVCLAGTGPIFPEVQLKSLEALIKEWKERYQLQTIHMHREVREDKTCPNMPMATWIRIARYFYLEA